MNAARNTLACRRILGNAAPVDGSSSAHMANRRQEPAFGFPEEQMKSRGELEAQISQAIVNFEKEYMGRGPAETKTFLLDDLVVVRLKGVLTAAEMKLVSAPENKRGRYLLKQVRNELLDHGRRQLESAIKDILGVAVRSLHTDISTRTGERIIVFTLKDRADYLSNETSWSALQHRAVVKRT